MEGSPLGDGGAPRRMVVVANETLAGTGVAETIRALADDGAEVRVVLPALPRTRIGHWLGSDVADALSRAMKRLDDSIVALNAAGLNAHGEIADPDPLLALDDAVRTYAPDRVVICTHPPERSLWLEKDVVRRARQRTQAPITHIVVDLVAGSCRVTHTVETSPAGMP